MTQFDVPPDDLTERQFAALRLSMAYDGHSYSHAEIRRRAVAEYADRLLADPDFARTVDAAENCRRQYRRGKVRMEVIR